MSKTYRADFVPHGAYFFGNEKTFSFDTGGRSFISSEQTPSQSTLLGALRYALLYNFEYEGRRLFKPDRKYNLSVNEQAAVDNLIGKGGFDIGSSSEQDFGAIEKLSPLFIYDTKKAEALVPTPRDHCISDSDEFKDFVSSADSDNGESFPYAPFSPDDFVFDEFTFSVDGSDSGIRRGFCKSFKVKNGLANSYMYVNSGSQIPAHWLFQKVQRIGRIPDIDSELGFIHTLFAVEDLYGVRVEKNENNVHIVFDGNKPNVDRSVFQMLAAWAEQAEKYRSGEISKEQYDEWRYTYPEKDTTQRWAKVPSQELSDALVEAFKDKLKD